MRSQKSLKILFVTNSKLENTFSSYKNFFIFHILRFTFVSFMRWAQHFSFLFVRLLFHSSLFRLALRLKIYYSLYIWTPPLMFTYSRYLVWRALLPNVWKILDSAKRIPYFPHLACHVQLFNISDSFIELFAVMNSKLMFLFWLLESFECFRSALKMDSASWRHEMKMTPWFISRNYIEMESLF